MKASWNWLTDYVSAKASAAEVADRLTMAGLTVESIEETPDDIVFEVEITSNRPDWLCHLGIAREIAALYGLSARVPAVKPASDGGEVHAAAALEVKDFKFCPYYTGRVIKGVTIAPSPGWLKTRVESIGLRSINNVVDATNFVMYECGQPLHAFDLAKVGGKKVVVRPAATGENIILIDGSKHTLKSSDLVIADAHRPIALAGVMGGLETEIGGDTADVFLESAKFDQYAIRITSKRLGISSDASYRFERGVDLEGVEWASRRSAEVIVGVAGGTLLSGLLAKGEGAQERRKVSLRMPRLSHVLGMEVPSERAREILSSLGFEVAAASRESLEVGVPSFRGDVKEEVDLIEEVARINGYDRIPLETGLKIDVGRRTNRERVTETAEAVMTAGGFYGCASYSLVSGDLYRKYSPWTSREPVYIENRAGQENAFVRTSLIPSLLVVRKTNEDHKVERPDVYEVAHIYLPSDDELPLQPLMLGAVAGGDVLVLKGAVEKVLEELGAAGAVFEEQSLPFLEERTGARILLGGEVIGYVGRLREDLRAAVDLREPASVAELNLSVFEVEAQVTKTFKPLQRFPGIDRDIAVVIGDQVRWAEAAAAVEASGVENLEALSFVSIYRGKPVPEGSKSLALRVVFRAADRTLTSEEADAATAKIVAALAAKFGARLR